MKTGKPLPVIARKQFYYVRHGQTDWNLEGKLQGCADIVLNQTGLKQAVEAKDRLSGEPIATICCSPLRRALKTAEIINQELKCPLIELEGLRECNFGLHEGTTCCDWLNDWLIGNTSVVPPDIEKVEDFQIRVIEAINQALDYTGPVLIVAHGGTYVPINNILPRNEQWNLPNCQPVRHDPPDENNATWIKNCL